MTPAAAKKRVLIVDDDVDFTRLCREKLEGTGYGIKTASSGKQALEMMETFHPDLVTLAIRMPDISGLKMLGTIRKNNRTLPIVLCSAYGEYKQDPAYWAADDFVAKIRGIKVLIKAVQQLFEERE